MYFGDNSSEKGKTNEQKSDKHQELAQTFHHSRKFLNLKENTIFSIVSHSGTNTHCIRNMRADRYVCVCMMCFFLVLLSFSLSLSTANVIMHMDSEKQFYDHENTQWEMDFKGYFMVIIRILLALKSYCQCMPLNTFDSI